MILDSADGKCFIETKGVLGVSINKYNEDYDVQVNGAMSSAIIKVKSKIEAERIVDKISEEISNEIKPPKETWTDGFKAGCEYALQLKAINK